MTLFADKVLLRTARKLSKRQRAAVAVLVRRGCAEPARHVPARTLRSLHALGLVQPTGSTETLFTLTASGHTVARYLEAA